MNTRLLREKRMPHCHRIGLLQIRHRSGKIIRHPLHRGEPDPRCATLPIVGGRTERCLISASRLRHRAEVMQDFAFEAHQREAADLIGGERETPFDKLQRRFLTIIGHLRASRGQISLRSLGVLGPIEMFGVQYRIAIGIPLGCTLV